MRCKSCDRALSDREATNVCLVTGEHPDLCAKCLEGLGILLAENPFQKETVVDDEPIVLDVVEEQEEYIPDEFDQVMGG